VAEQKLHGSEVLGASIDQRRLCPSHRMCPVLGTVKVFINQRLQHHSDVARVELFHPALPFTEIERLKKENAKLWMEAAR